MVSSLHYKFVFIGFSSDDFRLIYDVFPSHDKPCAAEIKNFRGLSLLAEKCGNTSLTGDECDGRALF